MIKQIPNIITSLNMLCGSVAVIFAVSGDLVTAAIFVFLGIFFDFFDGFAARLLKAQSEVGLQLDSLADMITSGLAPGIVMVQLLSMSSTAAYVNSSQLFSTEDWLLSFTNFLPFIGLLIVIASGYRLAKFNVDTRQLTSFIGLPTPANALLIMSLPLILHFQNSEEIESIILNTWFLIGLTIVSSIMLNAEIRLMGLKFKTWDFRYNAQRYIFLALSLILIVLFKFIGIPLIVVLYVLFSMFFTENKR